MSSNQFLQPEAHKHRRQHYDPSAGGGVRRPVQPNQMSREVAKALSNHDTLESCITTLSLAYEACKNTIEGSKNLAATRCGEHCIGIIDRRLEFLLKDLEKYRPRVASDLRKAKGWGVVGEFHSSLTSCKVVKADKRQW